MVPRIFRPLVSLFLWKERVFMKVFNNYVQNFDMSDEMIKRKYHHSLRVAGLCRILASELDYSDKDIEIAYECGLYHDIGRFTQAKIYHNFDDLKTVDHGELGYKIFMDKISPKIEYSVKDENMMAKCVMYHNKYLVPSRLSERNKSFINMVRDADKLDILYQAAYVKNTFVKNDEDISIEVKEAFKKHETIAKNIIKNESEHNVLLLALAFGFVYKESLKILKDNKYLERIKKVLNDKKYDFYFIEIDKYLKEMD